MNRYFSILVTLAIFYLIYQPNHVLTSSGGYGGGGSGASKLNLGVWIPPMTLRLPKFNMPKIKISATIKPRKNQPPMKIHLPEMSLNAKALGDDDNYGHHSNYNGGGGSYSSGGGESYSGGGESYSGGGSNYGGSSYGGDSGSYSSPGNSYSDNSASGYGYRASASNQNNQQQQQNNNYKPNNDQYQSTAVNQSNDYNRYQPAQQDARNAYYVENNQQVPASKYQSENVSYGASNSVQSGYRQSTPERIGTYRSSSSYVAPLSNYQKRQGNSAYGYAVNSNYARFARN